jgi:hypothetical protein
MRVYIKEVSFHLSKECLLCIIPIKTRVPLRTLRSVESAIPESMEAK